MTTTIANRYEYDQAGRKKSTYQKMNSDPEVQLSLNEYNAVGQLKNKSLQGGLQGTEYAYNPRGWLKTSTSPQFSMELKYENGTTPKYNGNITNQVWTNGGSSNTFTYGYDLLNRLTSGSATGMSETMTYNTMGNIVTMKRDALTASTYSYTGNRLNTINGTSAPTLTSYLYDANGNATTDGRNNRTISYNILNLPLAVSGTPSLAYTYDGMGNKLKRVVTNGTTITTTDYIGGVHYTNGAITFIQTEEGIALKSGSNYIYRYNLVDHLGNTRATVYRNPASGNIEPVQRDDYYAFGKQKPVAGGTNKYLYNSKELQDDLGQYDYGARFYDPVIGRWNVVDPLAERYHSLSPYNYVGNNAINAIDPDGRYIFGLFGSTSEQRKEAIQFASESGGDVQNITSKRNIRVDYTSVSTDGSSITATGETKRFGISEEGQALASQIITSNFGKVGQFDTSTGYVHGSGAVTSTNIELDVALLLTTAGIGNAARVAGAEAAELATTVGTNVVYQGFDRVTGAAKYVGITERQASIRFGEHLSSGTGKAMLDYRVVPGASNLSRIEARIIEQNLINQQGLGNLLNIRNSIAPKYWVQYGIK